MFTYRLNKFVANGFLVPPEREDNTNKNLFPCIHIDKTKSRLIWEMKSAKRTLPILSYSVDKDDVVGLSDGDFGGVRWERHVIDNIALFSILTKDYKRLLSTHNLYTHSIHTFTFTFTEQRKDFKITFLSIIRTEILAEHIQYSSDTKVNPHFSAEGGESEVN